MRILLRLPSFAASVKQSFFGNRFLPYPFLAGLYIQLSSPALSFSVIWWWEAAQDRERFPVLPGAFEPFLVATQLCAWAIRHQSVIAYLSSLLQRLRRVANNVARSLFLLLFLHQTENTQPFFPLASKVVSTRQWSRLAIERAKKFNHNRSGNPGA